MPHIIAVIKSSRFPISFLFSIVESLYTNFPKLAKYLKDNGFNTIELVGVDGGGCVSLTALGAIEHGLKVIINTEAIDTMFKNRQARMFKKLKEKGISFV